MMFELTGNKATESGLHTVENKLLLVSDGDHDVLYSGSNAYGARMLGVIVAEDDEGAFVRYLHIPLGDALYNGFLKKEVTLLEILLKVEKFFFVDFHYNDHEIDHAQVSLDDIPPEFRPAKNSYCPDLVHSSTVNFFSLKGRTTQ